MHDRKDDVRDVGLEALGNKASQLRERCPRGAAPMSRTGSAGMDGLKRKNSQGRDPRTQESKRAQPTAGERAYPTAGERTKATGDQTQCN